MTTDATKQGVKPDKLMVSDLNKCTGCMACTLACSSARFGVFGPAYSRMKILKFEKSGVDCPMFCQQCETPRCMEACPKGAIVRAEKTQIVVIDEIKCDGCGICMVACPYAAIWVHPETVSLKKGRRMLKCDLCGGDPKCVAWCETKAIQYIARDGTPAQDETIKEARENIIMAKKRFEIEDGTPLWRHYSKK